MPAKNKVTDYLDIRGSQPRKGPNLVKQKNNIASLIFVKGGVPLGEGPSLVKKDIFANGQ